MTEPKRWVDDGAPIAIERMLRAASDEQPSQVSLERTLGAVGVGAAVLTSSTASAAVGSTVKTASAVGLGTLFTKWTLFGVVLAGAVGVATGVAIVRQESPRPASAFMPHPPSPLSTAVRAAPPPAVATPAAPTTAAVVAAPDTAKTRRSSSSAEPEAATDLAPESSDGMAEETKCVDRARTATSPAAAIAALDDYEARFPVRRFAPEALYLRMKALIAEGKNAEARRIAAHLLEAYPRSAQASRAKSVLDANP